MGKNKKSYAKTLPILAISFAIFIGTLGALIINQQISVVADKQEEYLGNTLGLQLAKVAKNLNNKQRYIKPPDRIRRHASN